VPDPTADDADVAAADVPAKSSRKGKAAAKVSKTATAKASKNTKTKATSDAPVKNDVVIHKVDNGESLWTIARRHQVSVDQLMKWNGLQTQAVKPGQVLRLTASK